MTFLGWSQIAIVLALVLATAIPLSALIAAIYDGRSNFLSPALRAGRAPLLQPRRRR